MFNITSTCSRSSINCYMIAAVHIPNSSIFRANICFCKCSPGTPGSTAITWWCGIHYNEMKSGLQFSLFFTNSRVVISGWNLSKNKYRKKKKNTVYYECFFYEKLIMQTKRENQQQVFLQTPSSETLFN